MTKYIARAKRWDNGWELHVPRVGITQVKNLLNAEQQVRDLVETMTDRDATNDEVIIELDLGGFELELIEAREKVKHAEHEQIEAAKASRRVAAELRRRGLSVSDTAKVMGLSRGRISQLTK